MRGSISNEIHLFFGYFSNVGNRSADSTKWACLPNWEKRLKMADRISSLLWLIYCLLIVVPGYSLAEETENITGDGIEKGNSTKETFKKGLSDSMTCFMGM